LFFDEAALSDFRLSSYDYLLEEDRIAQAPQTERDHSRLMLLNRSGEGVSHRQVFELPEILQRGDLLVLNDTRVFPARLIGKKETGGQVEIFLLRDLGGDRWEVLTRGKVAVGMTIILPGDGFGVVEEIPDDGKRIIRFEIPGPTFSYLERHGAVPLPPYIHRNGDACRAGEDRERYQTIYASHPGAVAAPTAGLHFTERLLARLREAGVEKTFVTLHVGYGTFKPVQAEDIRTHQMDTEWYTIGEEAAKMIGKARQEGRRVIAVGTTTTRALESAVDDRGEICSGTAETDLFITPGHCFRAIDGLMTNFHLPRSTLLVLVSAFAGKARIDAAYREAIENDYRFYSYGDAMLIL